MSMGTRGSYTPAEQRNDVVNADVIANVQGKPTSDEDVPETDASADVKDADGVITGNGFAFGAPAVPAPKVATATSKNVIVQHGPGASRVKP